MARVRRAQLAVGFRLPRPVLDAVDREADAEQVARAELLRRIVVDWAQHRSATRP